MFSLVIKEKTGIVGGWLEVDGAKWSVPFGDTQEDYELAAEVMSDWIAWMDKEVDNVLELANGKGEGWTLRPIVVESIALVYTRS